MLPDLGWSELLVVAIVLIVVVGPKDLPKMLRTFGKTTAGLRKMAGDFRKQFDEALKEAELDDVRTIANDLKGLDPRNQIKEALNPLGKIGQDISSELKKATQDVEKSAKPKSVAETALDSSGDKMRAAQAKAEAPAAEPVAVAPGKKTATKKPAAKQPAIAKATTKPAATTTVAKAPAKPAPAAKAAPKKTAAPAATKAPVPAKAKPAPAKAAAKPKAVAKAKTTPGEGKA